MNNPTIRSINILTDEGLELLKVKAKYYGYYAENLKVLELIEEVQKYRAEIEDALIESMKHL